MNDLFIYFVTKIISSVTLTKGEENMCPLLSVLLNIFLFVSVPAYLYVCACSCACLFCMCASFSFSYVRAAAAQHTIP